jgi:hypothetical protein
VTQGKTLQNQKHKKLEKKDEYREKEKAYKKIY